MKAWLALVLRGYILVPEQDIHDLTDGEVDISVASSLVVLIREASTSCLKASLLHLSEIVKELEQATVICCNLPSQRIQQVLSGYINDSVTITRETILFNIRLHRTTNTVHVDNHQPNHSTHSLLLLCVVSA